MLVLGVPVPVWGGCAGTGDASTSAGVGWGCQSWGSHAGAGGNQGARACTGTVLLLLGQRHCYWGSRAATGAIMLVLVLGW